MDKYTWIGFFLIALVLVGFSLFNRPSKEQLEAQRRYNDSIALVRQQQQAEEMARQQLQAVEASAANMTEEQLTQQREATYGIFAPSALSNDTTILVETDKLILTFSSKGGRITKAQLKDYKSYGDTVNALSLFNEQISSLDFIFSTEDNHYLHTQDMYFSVEDDRTTENNERQLTLRLNTTVDNSWVDFVYTIPIDDYMIRFAIVPHNAQNLFSRNATAFEMDWKSRIPQQERGRKFEERYATLQYMYTDGDVKNLSESKHDTKSLNTPLRWIAYKDQFFSTVMIADKGFASAAVESTPQNRNTNYIKDYQTKAYIAYEVNKEDPITFRVYMGPNHYNTLKAYDSGVDKQDKLNLKKLVPLGWKIVAWINMILVIPMFDLFTSWGLHIGLVIFLMTLVIKLIILPFVFSSYRSSAKMRVLKPQIDAINEKYPADKMQERQQATMALYNRAGVSPMSGCLPMLFQFPVLMAMFWFFPTAIELRGKSFLWADDLSTYDAIFTWSTNLPLIGNHLSLFCLLMTITNIVYTYINMQTSAPGNDTSAKIMKWMMYLMPLMFFFIFNDYAAGLSYYYLLSLFITILQTMIFRWSINDEKLLKQMEARAAKNANKPKKSGLMARLEKMQREQQQAMRQQAKKNARR